MVILPKQRLVFIEVPRTGSRSMRTWLMRHRGGIFHDWEHSRDIPENAADFTRMCVVREPMDRALSLFRWALHQHRDKYPGIVEAVGGTTFTKFAVWLGSGRWRQYPDERLRTMFMSQTEFLAGVHPHHVLRFERIPDALRKFRWAGSLAAFPRVNQSAQVDVVDVHIGPVAVEAVARWEPEIRW